MPRCTVQAHQLLDSLLSVGDVAIDLTAGNGHDTLFLLGRVGPSGIVYAFDTQPQALEKTALRCLAFRDSLKLLSCCHSRVSEMVPAEVLGRVGAVVANLGYLPGGDEGFTTHESTSVKAVRAALPLLRPGGVVSVICYRGHPGGEEETAAMMQLFETLSGKAGWRVEGGTDALSYPGRPVWCWAQWCGDGVIEG